MPSLCWASLWWQFRDHTSPKGFQYFLPLETKFLGGESTRIYHAALCGGCSFDGLTAQVQVNLVNNPWDCELGDYMIISVEDGNGSVIATNVDGRQMPVPNFNFTYSAKYKDLFLHIKTGPTPQFLFTLSLLFDFKTRVHVPAHCVPRWQMTASEHAVSQKYKQGNDTAELYQVFKTLTTQEVPTEETKSAWILLRKTRWLQSYHHCHQRKPMAWACHLWLHNVVHKATWGVWRANSIQRYVRFTGQCCADRYKGISWLWACTSPCVGGRAIRPKQRLYNCFSFASLTMIYGEKSTRSALHNCYNSPICFPKYVRSKLVFDCFYGCL